MSKPVDIAIVGVQKAATSSLQFYLGQHPQILTHSEKEFTFFLRDEEYNAGYAGSFKKYFPGLYLEKKILIKNVGIIFWEEVIQRLYNHNPEAKLILVLRNPVSRAYSAYWFAKMQGYETEDSFESALQPGRKNIDDRINKGMIAYLERGNYVSQIKMLYKYFSPQKVRIVLLEDLKENPSKLLKELFSFCEVDTSFDPVLYNKVNVASYSRLPWLSRMIKRPGILRKGIRNMLPEKVKNRLLSRIKKINRKEFTPPEMNPETKLKLIQHFKPMIDELSTLLNRDLSHWCR